MSISEVSGQGAKQFVEQGMAFLLSSVIGLEREIRHKSAGLRTYTIIGTGATLFLLVSKYGFTDVLADSRIVFTPTRVAARIVTGIGLIGAGVEGPQTSRSDISFGHCTGVVLSSLQWPKERQ